MWKNKMLCHVTEYYESFLQYWIFWRELICVMDLANFITVACRTSIIGLQKNQILKIVVVL